MNRNKKLIKNTVLIAIGSFTNKFLVFLLVPIYTYSLTTSEFGIADVIVSSINLIFPIFTLLMSESVLRFSLEKDSDKKTVFSTSLYIQIFGTLVLIFLSPILLLSSALSKYIFLILGYYTLRVFRLLLLQFIRGIEKIKLYTVSNIIQIVTVLISSVLFLVIFNIGIQGFFLGYILGDFISIIFSAIKIKIHKYLISPQKINYKDIKSQLKYSLPMIPNSLGWWINTSIDRFAIIYYITVASSGIYAIAYKLPSLLTSFTSVFIGAWQISSVRDFGTTESRSFFSDIYKKYSSFSILLTGIILIFIKLIAKILFQGVFYEAWSVATIIMVSYLFQTMSAFLGTVFTASKKTKVLFYSTIIAAGINVLLNIFFIPRFGIYGAAFATLITFLYVFIHRLVSSNKILVIEKRTVQDFISYLLICIMIFFINNTKEMISIYSLLIYIVILIFNYSFILDTIKSIVNYLKKISKKNFS